MSDPQQPASNEDAIPTFDPPEQVPAQPNPTPADAAGVPPVAAPAVPIAPHFAPAPPAFEAPQAPVTPTAPYAAPAAYGTPPIAPAPGYAAPSYGAPAYSTPNYKAPGYAAPGGAYTAPTGGYTAAYAGAPEKASSGLGLTALLLALAASVVASIVVGFFAMQIGVRLSSSENLEALEYAPLTFLSPARDVVLGAEITFWVATVLGIWALVQGIIAVVKRRGRGMGIAAIIIAAIGPFFFGTIAWIMFAVGLGAGAASLG